MDYTSLPFELTPALLQELHARLLAIGIVGDFAAMEKLALTCATNGTTPWQVVESLEETARQKKDGTTLAAYSLQALNQEASRIDPSLN